MAFSLKPWISYPTSPLTKQWDEATAIEQHDCLKTAETSCRILCGVIAAAYKNAPSKNLKTQILNLYALNYTNEQLKKIHKHFEELSDRQIKKARQQAKINGPGLPVKKSPCAQTLGETRSLSHVIDRPYFYQDVANGQSGERLTMLTVIGIVTRSMMISQYLSFCAENGFEPLSRATMFRVLKVREASQRKSLQGLILPLLMAPKISAGSFE